MVLFDFDGTITRRDTTRIILRAAASRRPLRGTVYALALVFSQLFLSQERFHRHKDVLLFSLLERMSEMEVATVVARYRAQVEPLLRPDMLERMKECDASGMRVLVVSASPAFAVERVLEDLRVSVIGAKVSPAGGGSTVPRQMVVSCFGAQKVARFHEWAAREGWQGEVVAAWSDSLMDLPLMQLAKRRYWVGPAAKAGAFQALDPEGVFVRLDD
jgi:phosphatidylglycerophosphatase C